MKTPARNKYRNYFIVLHILAIIGLIGLVMTFTSCRTPQQLFETAQKRGLKIECKTDTVKVVETIINERGDTIYKIKDSIVYVPFENVVTKWETKYKYKTIRDSFEVVKYQTKWKVKEVKVTEKTKVKQSKVNWWKWYLAGIFTVIFVVIAVKTYKAFVNPPQLFKDK